MSARPRGPKDALLGLGLAREFRARPLQLATHLARTYGDLVYFRMGPLRAYLVNEPELIHEVLSTRHKHFRRPEFVAGPLRAIDGNGLVLSEGDYWRRQRRLVQPAFATGRFEAYAQVTVEYTRRMLDGWQSGQSIDAAEAMTRLTLEIIAKTLFGVEVEGQTERLGEAVRIVSETVVREAGYPWHLPDWLPLASKRRKRWAIRTLDDMAWRVLRQRRASGGDRGDLLSMLLLAVDNDGDGRGMTDQQARDEAITLFNAGHDSTAAALAWTWYLVARHPEIEARLIDEADAVLSGRAATYGDVARLPYAEMVVKESMRLYPPTWMLFPREVVSSVELGGYTIPPRAWIYIFPWVTHRDARFFPDPDAFDPERFAPTRIDEIPPFAYIPFGGGPRACIGAGFATMEMVLILATVLQRFRLRLAADQGVVEPEPLISIRPKGGLRVSLEHRRQPAVADKDRSGGTSDPR
ncbi:MAG: cytochrome P450 [Planctomycetota bacterium]|nr:MAG: cytochrome P450 [Planctomycetota bacterium]